MLLQFLVIVTKTEDYEAAESPYIINILRSPNIWVMVRDTLNE